MKKFWAWVLICSPVIFTGVIIALIAITNILFSNFQVVGDGVEMNGNILFVLLGPLWFLMSMLVLPICIPIFSNMLIKIKIWHVILIIVIVVVSNLSYFLSYVLINGTASSYDSESKLVAMIVPIISSISAFITGVMVLIYNKIKSKCN